MQEQRRHPLHGQEGERTNATSRTRGGGKRGFMGSTAVKGEELEKWRREKEKTLWRFQTGVINYYAEHLFFSFPDLRCLSC